MQTPSHFLISAAAGRKLIKATIPFHFKAFLLGAVLPDLPFALLTLGGEIYYRLFASVPVDGMSIMEFLHFDLFFNNWWWIAPHNFFHSLVINGLIIGIGWLLWRKKKLWGALLFWLGMSTQIHTVIDIFTHTSDGPLLFFPLNWRYRFASPVSYWETGYFGSWFFIFETILDVLLLAYLGWEWRQRRKGSKKTGVTA